MPSKIAVYPGTFDPFTNGHMDIARRAGKMFDKVVIPVSDHGKKKTVFTIDERCEMIKQSVASLGNVEVVPFKNLLVEVAHATGASVIIRGLRVSSDFEYEFQMNQFNLELDNGMETIYLMAAASTLHISSSHVKELGFLGADMKKYVPNAVEVFMENKNWHR